MAVPTGFEPAIFCVTGRRDNHYTTEPLWLRKKDLNQRPSGYEPDELPDCSIPRYINKWRRKRDSNPRAVADLLVFKTSPFNRTWVFLRLFLFSRNKLIIAYKRKFSQLILIKFIKNIIIFIKNIKS